MNSMNSMKSHSRGAISSDRRPARFEGAARTMRNKLNLSVAADLIEQAYEKRDLPGETLAVLFRYLSDGVVKSYIDIPAIFGDCPELKSVEWARMAYIQFNSLFDYENEELVRFNVRRDMFIHYIIPAMISSGYAGGEGLYEDVCVDYANLVPESVEVFIYEDDLIRELAKLPDGPEGRGREVSRRVGAPEKDRGWLYFSVAVYMSLYQSKFGKNASDKEIMNFISGLGGLMGSLPDQISDVTLQRELAEMKRRWVTVAGSFHKKCGESI